MGRGNPRQGGKNIGFLLLVMIVTYNEVRNRFGDDDDFKGGQGKATSIEIENLKNKIINLPPTYWRILSILAKYSLQKPKYSKFLKKIASLELPKGNPFPLRWARIVAFGAFLSKTLKESL